ncbi:MAG: hypothetical protein HOV79_15510 [Hamadaea sp.]|nr:hypothetical protein [Hamadaea sp.]
MDGASMGAPFRLPQRRRSSMLSDWSDPVAVRGWVFRPVPVHQLPDLDAVERVYRWMLSNGWGGRDRS